jgi:hypothetical protein
MHGERIKIILSYHNCARISQHIYTCKIVKTDLKLHRLQNNYFLPTSSKWAG